MDLALRVFLFLLIFGCSVEANVSDDSYNASMENEEKRRAQLIAENKQLSKDWSFTLKLEKKEWIGNKPCYWKPEFPLCKVNNVTKDCFGNPIAYDYSNEQKLHVPKHLRLVKNFPACWELLEPLVCGVYFRPCRWATTQLVPGAPTVREEFIQIFPYNFCSKARKHCPFLVEKQLWPVQLDCDASIAALQSGETPKSVLKRRRLLFDSSNSCKFEYNKIQPAPSSGCLFPLIEMHEEVREVDPIIDRCYMPCSSIFATDQQQLKALNSVLLGFSLTLTVLFVLAAVYFLCATLETEHKFVLFGLKHMCTTVGLWQFFLVVSLLWPTIKSACVGTEGIIRAEIKSGEWDWCTTKWFFLHLFLVASYEWLFLLTCRLILKPVQSWFDELVEDRFRENTTVYSTIGVAIVIVVALIVSFVGLMLRSVTPDGLTNTCYHLLDSVKSNIPFYSFLIILIFVPLSSFLSVYYFKPKEEIDDVEDAFTNGRKEGEEQKLNQFLSSQEASSQTDPLMSEQTTEHNIPRRKQLYRELFGPTLAYGLFFVLCISAMFSIHFFFNFHSKDEKFEIERRINCVFEHVRQLNKSNMEPNATTIDSCYIRQISHFGLLELFLYAYFLPVLPFICILAMALIGLLGNKNLLGVYMQKKSVQNMRDILNESESISIHPKSLRSFVPSNVTTELWSTTRSHPPADWEHRNKSMRKERGLPQKKNDCESVKGSLTDEITSSKSLSNEKVRRIDMLSRFDKHKQTYRPPTHRCQNLTSDEPGTSGQNVEGVYMTYKQFENCFQLCRRQAFQHFLEFNQMTQTQQELLQVADGEDSDDFDSDASADSEEKRMLGVASIKSTESMNSSSSSSKENLTAKESDQENECQHNIFVQEISRFVEKNNVSNKSLFFYETINNFHSLLEEDPQFNKLCQNFQTIDPQNPERSTTNDNHKITIEELIRITNRLTCKKDLCRVGVLCSEACRKTMENLKQSSE